MPALKSYEVVARPSYKEEGSHFWSTSFMLFASDEESGASRTVISGTSVEEFRLNLIDWVKSLPAPAEKEGAESGWSVAVLKGSGRWASGFKAAFERNAILIRPGR